jgi:hypothetical protein
MLEGMGGDRTDLAKKENSFQKNVHSGGRFPHSTGEEQILTKKNE